MIKKTTLTVQVPPMTDVAELLNAYGSLLSALGIPHQLPITGQASKFTHPDATANQKLTDEFFEAMQQLKGAVAFHHEFCCIDASIGPRLATFVFQYNE